MLVRASHVLHIVFWPPSIKPEQHSVNISFKFSLLPNPHYPLCFHVAIFFFVVSLWKWEESWQAWGVWYEYLVIIYLKLSTSTDFIYFLWFFFHLKHCYPINIWHVFTHFEFSHLVERCDIRREKRHPSTNCLAFVVWFFGVVNFFWKN